MRHLTSRSCSLAGLSSLAEARRAVPSGQLRVDADALRRARREVPRGEFHVDADALRRARREVPRGEFHVDADALRRARREVPRGEFHSPLLVHVLVREPGGFVPPGGPHRCVLCGGPHRTQWCPVRGPVHESCTRDRRGTRG